MGLHPVRFSLAAVQSLFQEPGERTTERVKEGEKKPNGSLECFLILVWRRG